jgi:hypothetical protein
MWCGLFRAAKDRVIMLTTMPTWNTSLALALACALSLPLGARAQDDRAAAGSKPIELSALDYVQIQQLVARYARAIDTCSNNGYDYADLFAADGFFAPWVNGQIGTKFHGRERLAEASGGGSRGCKNVGWIKQGVHHMYVNHIITPTADGATGTVDMLMIGLGGDPNKIEHDGYYEDTYTKTPQGWRFKSRVHHALLVNGQRATPTASGAPSSQSGTSR